MLAREACQLGAFPPQVCLAAVVLELLSQPNHCLSLAVEFWQWILRLEAGLVLLCALAPCCCTLQVIAQRYQRPLLQSPSPELHIFQAKRQWNRSFSGGLNKRPPKIYVEIQWKNSSILILII